MPENPSTDDEQISEEGGEIEDSSEEEITTVTDSAEDQDEESVEETVEELPADNNDSEAGNVMTPSAVTPSDAVITVESKGDGDATDTIEKLAWVGGCVDGSNKLATGKDLRFRVVLKNGQSLSSVGAIIGDATTATPLSPESGTGVDAIYKVAWGDIKTTVEGKDVGRPVKIVVTTTAQKYTVTFVGDNADIHSVVPVNASDVTAGDMLGDKVGAPVSNAAFDTAVTYAVVVPATHKLVEIKVGDKKLELVKKDLKANASATETTKYDTISVKPSDYVNVGDTGFTVTVTTAEKATLTIDATSKISADATIAASVTNTEAAKFIQYNADNNEFDSITEGDEVLTGAKAKSLAFKVTATDANHKVTAVTAKVAPTDADPETGTAVTVAPATVPADGEYTIALDQKGLNDFDKDVTLTIFVTTDYNSASENIHKVTFDGDLKNVTLTTTPALEEDNSVTVVTNNSTTGLTISVTPKDGYVLPERGGTDSNKTDRVISVTKRVKYETDTAGTYGAEEEQLEKLAVGTNGSATLVLTGSDTNYKGAPTENPTAKKFTVVSATVTINTEFEENNAEKQLYVNNSLEDEGYKVEYAEAGSTTFKEAVLDEIVTGADEIADNTWYIPEKAGCVKVTVDTEKTLDVTLDDNDLDKEEGAGSSYIIPAAILKTADDNGSTLMIQEKTVVPEEKEAAVKVKVNTEDVILSNYKVNGSAMSETLDTPDDDDYYTLLNEAIVGKSLSMTFTAKDGATLKSVSYTMGEEGEETPGTVEPKKGVATLEIEEVTGPVTVEVESESAYVVKLYSVYEEANEAEAEDKAEELEKDKDGVYEADYTAENIQIRLYKTADVKDVEFYDVVVKDGNATAETGATVATNGMSATIAKVDKSERGKVLTIEVYKKGEATPFVAKLRTNATSSKVKVTVNGKAVGDSVTMPLDASMTFKVESVGASTSDLGVKLFKDDKALTSTEQGWFENSGSISMGADGTFTIDTTASKDARGEVEVRIYNRTEDVASGKTEAALEGGSFKLNVEGYMVNNDISAVTATPGTASNKTVRINLNTTFKNKKNPPAAPNTGDLYYKVVLGDITGDIPATLTGVTKLTDTERTKYYLLDDYANPAQTVAIDLVNDTRTGAAAQEDIDAVLTTTIEEVSLVQSVVANPAAEADYVSGPKANIKEKDSKLTTKAPLYETKLSVKTVNGAAVFTGQTDVKVATPVFGKDTGYDSLTVQFVDTKTGVLRGWSSDSKYPAEYENFEAYVDPNDNSIYVSSTDGEDTASEYKTLGVKVIAAYPSTNIGDGYAATAVVKLNIKQGIHTISADESKAKLPKTIYVNGKNTSVKITPKYNDGITTQKPAKAAVTWNIDSTAQNANIKKNLNAVNSKGKAAPTISVKNGTVTVTKDYQFGKTEEENTFTVTAKAADFATNSVDKTFTFTITDEQDKLEAGSIVIVDYQGNVKDASALKAEDFDNAFLYVAALKNDVKKNQDKYLTDRDFMPVTIASGSKANLEVGVPNSNNMAKLTFKKPGTKLKINVNTVDGGKASKNVKVKDTLTVNIAPYENLGLKLTGADNVSYAADNTETISYAGGSNQVYTLNLQHKYLPASDGVDGIWQNDTKYKNVKVTVKGGKFVSDKAWAKDNSKSKMGTAVVVTSKDGKATITVTDTANKDKTKNHKDYTIQNTSYKEASKKAPSIKLYSPKKLSLYYYGDITYQVTDKANDNYAGQYVKVTPDYTAANNMANDLADEYGYIAFAKIDENGRFDCFVEGLYGGSYKMIATVGEMKRGEFLPLAKDVKLSFSIPKEKALNKSLSVTAKYTLDAKSKRTADIVVKTDSRNDYVISDAKNVIKSANVQGKTKDTHTNKFTKYFEVKPIEDSYTWNDGEDDHEEPTLLGYTIGLKDNLTAQDIADITGNSAEAKENRIGYITVTNGNYASYDEDEGWVLGEEYNTKDIKVTISFKENKYTVTGASVFAPKDNTPVTVNVSLMSGKNSVPVVAAALAETPNSFAASVKAGQYGEILITSNATAEAKKHDVKLKVVPADSGFIMTAAWNATANKWDLTYVNKEGTTTYANEAELIEACGVEVTAKIDVKAVDAKKVIKIAKPNVTLSAGDYVLAANKMGDYVAYVPYTFLAGNTDISAIALAKDAKKDNKDLNEIAGKTLITVAKSIYPGYLEIKVSKEALEDQYTKTEANKKAAAKDKVPVVTTYGAKLKVPVVFTYTNNGTTTETVNLNVTMPKKPMNFDDVKNVLNGTTELGSGKAKRNVKTEIQKINTPQADSSIDILNGLLTKVWSKVDNEIPADADVILVTDWSDLYQYDEDSYEWIPEAVTKAELNDGTDAEDDKSTDPAEYDEIMTKGTAKVNLIIKNRIGGATETLSYNFDAAALGVKHTLTSNGTAVEAGIKDKIQTYLNSADFIVTNDLTEDKLLADIWALDGVKEYDSDRDSVNIWLTGFNLKPATERAKGSFNVTVHVNEYTYTLSPAKEIAKINNLGDVETVLGEKLDETAVLKIVDECSGIKDVIQKNILEAAKAAIGNENLTVTYAQRDKVDTPAGGNTTTAETEDDFTYEPATSTQDGKINFNLLITSKASGRTVTYGLNADATIQQANAAKYFDTADKAKAAVEKAVVSSDPTDESNLYDKLKDALTGVENTQDSVETAVKNALKEDALKTTILGWTAENISVTYTPAQPDAGTTKNPGKVTITADIVLKGDPNTKTTLTVTNAPVVDWDASFQTAAQLKAAIEAAKAIEVEANSDLPTGDTAAQTKIQAVVTDLVTGDGLNVEYVYDDATTPAAFSSDTEAKTAKYENVKINIKKGGKVVDTCTVTFTFSVKATPAPTPTP